MDPDWRCISSRVGIFHCYVSLPQGKWWSKSLFSPYSWGYLNYRRVFFCSHFWSRIPEMSHPPISLTGDEGRLRWYSDIYIYLYYFIFIFIINNLYIYIVYYMCTIIQINTMQYCIIYHRILDLIFSMPIHIISYLRALYLMVLINTISWDI